MLNPGREFVGSPPPPQIGGNSSAYYHHGITFAHVDQLNRSIVNKNGKKASLATRISNKFKRSSSADKSQARIINHVNTQQQPEHHHHHHHPGFSPHFRPRRTFYNVLPTRNNAMAAGSMRGPSSASRRFYVHPPVSAAVTPTWASNTPPKPTEVYIHRPVIDNTLAINGNVCLCEIPEGSSGGKLCRRCGLEKQASKAKVESWWRDWMHKQKTSQNEAMMRRSQSEESVSTSNPYEAMRKQRLTNNVSASGRYFSGWNEGESTEDDEDEEASDCDLDEEDKARAYAEADYIYNSVRRRPQPPPVMHMPPMVPYIHVDPQRLQRSSSNVIRRSIILKTPSTPKMLPTPPRPTGTPISTSSAAKKAVVLVAASTPNNNNKEGSESSAKESLSDDNEHGSDHEDVSHEEKLKRLQIRNLKRLREKVREEEEKLRALVVQQQNSSSSSSSAKIKENHQDQDYDADISALESPKKVNKVGQSSLRRSRNKSRSLENTIESESKLMQLYHRRKRQQEQQIRCEFNPGELTRNLPKLSKDSSSRASDEGLNHSHLFNDTTRIRMSSRPSIKEAFAQSSGENHRLGRRGISQSFKEKVAVRPKDPPPPPPPNKAIYDISENDEAPDASINSNVVILHTNNGNKAPSKPPRQKKKERSQSFTPSSTTKDHIIADSPRAKSYEDPSSEEKSIIILKPDVKSSSTSSLESAKDKDHIYEEIPTSANKNRPLPPIPKVSTTSTVVSVSSKLSSLKAQIDEEDVKSIFVGATKYEILNYLEDAKERGVDNLEHDDNESEAQLEDRNHANRVSQFSNSSGSSSSTIIIHNGKDKWTTSVEIERNDSGLGSETGKSGKRPVKIRDKLKLTDLHICEDCDQPIEDRSACTKSDETFDPNSSTCLPCAKRRCERKEIITEIIETEIKYGRDLRIILEEFRRPMLVAGLLSHEQLSAIFLNVEELAEVNKSFTESLRDAIELALDEGDEDLCTVKIGQIFKDTEPMLGAFKSYCTRQGSSSALLAALEKERELLRIFLRVSQMENTILRRMNLSSFLMVPVQRVTKYPLLLSRLLKVTPSHHEDRTSLQESRERIEHHLENMNQEAKDTNSTRLWRRISMINVSSYRKMDSQLDVLGNTTWGIRKMALDVLQWTNKSREDVNFVLEGKLMFTQATEANWRRWNVKLTPVSALLVTLGRNSLEPPSSLQDDPNLNFPADTGATEAALLLIREKNNRFSMIRDPIFLGNCIICWEQDWDDCFEVQEFISAKESLIFKGEDASRTRQWFKALQFYGLNLGNWRRRRNGMANIMIYGASSFEKKHSFVPKSSSMSQLVDLASS